MVVNFGLQWAKKYHLSLILIPFIAAIAYTVLHFTSLHSGLHLLVFIPLFKHLRFVSQLKDPRNFDPELKKVAVQTFLWSILFTLSYL